MAEPVLIPFNPVVPYHGDVKTFAMLGPFQGPMEYDGWREESRSWKDGAYLGAALALSPIFSPKGPDAERFFSENFVNDFANLPVGGFRHGIMCDEQGRIMKEGREIGFSSGRAVSQTYRRMISLGFIERDLAKIGTEVTVLWGSPGSRQKEIQATVARFPYLQVERNDQVDVEKIPRLGATPQA